MQNFRVNLQFAIFSPLNYTGVRLTLNFMRASKLQEFVPKSYLYFKSGYTFKTFRKDLMAGITVGIVSLPLAMAFAIASGVTPSRGLYTAIVAGFLISLLGGSRVQIGGPTGAFVVIVYGIIQRTGYEGLCISTLMAAFLLVLFGIFRFGSFIKYVPHSLVTGFTTGIALLIFSMQIKDFFGLKIDSPPSSFFEKWIAYFHAFPSLDAATFVLSAATLGFIVFLRRHIPSLPWGILAIVLATGATFFFHLPVETVQSRFGEIPRMLPIPNFSHFHIPTGHFKELVMDAFTIAFLGGIESLLSAVIGDGMIGGRHRSNCELIAQGIANFGSILFGGIPATGAIARTATNVKTGGQTPAAGMIHAIVLLLILLFLAPLVSQIPLAALSAVLIMVAWNMSELPHFIRLLKAPLGDRLVLLTSFLLTVFVDITIAISVGMILACFVFMKQMSKMGKVVPLEKLFEESAPDPKSIENQTIPKELEIYEIQGPFFFGTANILKNMFYNQRTLPKAFILRLRSVPMMDASGMHALKEFYEQCQKKHIEVYLSEVKAHTKNDLKKFGILDVIGEKHIFPTFSDALRNASTKIAL